MLFSALVMRYVSEKLTSNVKMANNKLQVSIIKITESSENNSIHRLDVSGLTGLWGGGGAPPPRAPPCSPASYGSDTQLISSFGIHVLTEIQWPLKIWHLG